MTTYLAEWNVSGQHEAFPPLVRRSAVAMADVRSDRVRAQYVGAVLSWRDEMAFCLLEGPSESSLDEVARRLGVRFERISEAIHLPARE